MSFIYFILSTVFGLLSAFFVFTLMIALSKGIFVIVIISILLLINVGLTIFFQRLYKRRKAPAAEPAPYVDVDYEGWKTYLESNKQAIESFSKEIDQVLMNHYHFKGSYRPEFTRAKYPQYVPIDAWLYKERQNPQRAAKVIFDEIVFTGNNGNPDIFTESYAQRTLPRFHKWNRIFFGSYNPTAKAKTAVIFCFVCIASILYGLPQVFLGPNYDLYVPSEEWRNIAIVLTWALTIMAGVALYKNKEYKERLVKKHGAIGSLFIHLILLPVVFFALHLSFQTGLGKALNEIAGQDDKRQYLVIKDLQTRKKVGKHSYTDAYCIKLTPPVATFFSKEYCLRKEHYDLLPASAPIMMTFYGTGSVFGFRISAYDDEFKTLPSTLPEARAFLSDAK